jgi:hypothetical protein
MQQALGDDWQKLPIALKAHYQSGDFIENGYMDIEYPRLMQPYLNLLRLFGALPNRRGKQLETVVEKQMKGGKQYWQRKIYYPNGKVIHFNSVMECTGAGELIEFVNPFFGLKMAVHTEGERLCYRGVCVLVKLGRLTIRLPEWLVLGHTTIDEEKVDETHYRMDFRLTHPWFGQVFRYAGEFEVTT